MSLTPEEELAAEQRLKAGQAASDLCIAASRLRDADDALVALGRQLRETDADRGMPDDADAERALAGCVAVSDAYRAMRLAEERFETITGYAAPGSSQ